MKVLLVGGNKHQLSLIGTHFKGITIRHIARIRNAEIHSQPDIVLIWNKHSDQELQDLVIAQLDTDAKIVDCHSNTDILVALIDVFWDHPSLYETTPTLEDDITEVPTAIIKTNHRYDEFISKNSVADQILTDEILDEISTEDLPHGVELCEHCESVIPMTVDECACQDSLSDPRPYMSRTRITVDIEDQFGNIIGSRTVVLEFDGHVYIRDVLLSTARQVVNGAHDEAKKSVPFRN